MTGLSVAGIGEDAGEANHRPKGPTCCSGLGSAFRVACTSWGSACSDAPALQVIDDGQQVASIAPQTVRLSDNDLVTVPQVIQHFVQLADWPSNHSHHGRCRSGDARGLQRGTLQVRILVNGADPWRVQHSPRRLP